MSEARYLGAEASALFDRIPDALWVYDAATLRFLDANPAALEMLGTTRPELLGLTIADIRPPEDVPALLAAVAAMTADDTHAGVWRILSRHGEAFHCDVHWRRVDFHGTPAVLATVRDITALDSIVAEDLLALAGRKVRLGGWRVELDPPGSSGTGRLGRFTRSPVA